MSEQHCPEGTCHGCYGCECLDNPDCFTCNDRRETRQIERERIIGLLQDEITALTQTRISDSWDLALGVQHALALIKGEN